MDKMMMKKKKMKMEGEYPEKQMGKMNKNMEKMSSSKMMMDDSEKRASKMAKMFKEKNGKY